MVAAGAALMLVIAAATPDQARAQAKLEASYTISVARIRSQRHRQRGDRDGSYTVSMSGRAAGLMRVLTSGEGALSAHGIIKDGRLSPASYTSKTTSDDDTLDVKMMIEDGRVTDLPPRRRRRAMTACRSPTRPARASSIRSPASLSRRPRPRRLKRGSLPTHAADLRRPPALRSQARLQAHGQSEV